MKLAQHWRLNAQRYNLQATIDDDGNVNFPPRPITERRIETRYVFVEQQHVGASEKAHEMLVVEHAEVA